MNSFNWFSLDALLISALFTKATRLKPVSVVFPSVYLPRIVFSPFFNFLGNLRNV